MSAPSWPELALQASLHLQHHHLLLHLLLLHLLLLLLHLLLLEQDAPRAPPLDLQCVSPSLHLGL